MQFFLFHLAVVGFSLSFLYLRHPDFPAAIGGNPSVQFYKMRKKQCIRKRWAEPCAGVAPYQFFDPEDFINEKFRYPKRQKYSKYEKQGGYAEKKKIFRAKKSPQTLDVRGDPVKLGVKRKRQSFSFRSRNLKIGKYYLVHPETKSVFRFIVKSTVEMGRFTGITPEFPAVHISSRSKKTGEFHHYDRVSWYDKWRSDKKGELAPCPQALRITDVGIYYSDVAEKIWNYLVTKGYVRDSAYNWDHSENTGATANG